jgi:hypothetical protein
LERHTPIADKGAKGIREADGTNTVAGKKWGEGPIEVVLDAKLSPYFFGAAMGTISTTLTGGLYVHTITRNNACQPKTLNLWIDRGVDKVEFPYAVVNNLEMNFADDVAKLKADILSRTAVVGRTVSPSYVSLDLYTFKNASVVLTNGGNTSELKIREFNLKIANNAELVYAPNSNDVDRIVSKSFEVSGSLTVLFETETQKAAFTELTKQQVVLTFTGSTTGKIVITIPQFRVDNWQAETPIDDLSQETVDFVAEYNGTKSIDIVVSNDVTSY